MIACVFPPLPYCKESVINRSVQKSHLWLGKLCRVRHVREKANAPKPSCSDSGKIDPHRSAGASISLAYLSLQSVRFHQSTSFCPMNSPARLSEDRWKKYHLTPVIPMPRCLTTITSEWRERVWCYFWRRECIVLLANPGQDDRTRPFAALRALAAV